MKRRSNQLDPRIIGGLRAVLMPNDVLTEEKAARFSLSPLRTVGYAAECLMDFQDLGTDPSCHLFRIVEVNYGSPFPFRCRVVGNTAAIGDFSFFLPASQVAAYADSAEAEKPKARPYTLQEFLKKFHTGQPIKFRQKRAVGHERYLIVNGYHLDDWEGRPTPYICIGASLYSLDALFYDYEWQETCSEDWWPFGVEGITND